MLSGGKVVVFWQVCCYIWQKNMSLNLVQKLLRILLQKTVFGYFKTTKKVPFAASLTKMKLYQIESCLAFNPLLPCLLVFCTIATTDIPVFFWLYMNQSCRYLLEKKQGKTVNKGRSVLQRRTEEKLYL